MADKNIPAINGIPYKSDLDKIEKILTIYSIVKEIKFRDFEKDVLKYYLVYGYNKETQEMIMEDLGKSDVNIRVTDTWLRKNGFLNLGVNNKRKSSLSKDMEMMRKDFILDKKDVYALIFKREQMTFTEDIVDEWEKRTGKSRELLEEM